MKRKKSSSLASLSLTSALLLTVLAGCGTTSGDVQSNPPAVTETDTSASASASDSESQGTMLLGKVKSIEGNILTIYTSSIQPGEGNGGPGDKAPQGEAPQGEVPQGETPANLGTGTPPEQGEAPEGSVPELPAGGDAPPSMDHLFTEETMEITITDTTNMPSADLKTDDIVDITLEEGTQDALSVQVHEGFKGPGQINAEDTTTETETP